jgi:urease accessory protein
MTAAHRQAENLAELDDLCHAFLSSHVANRASRLQGQAMLASARRIFKLPALDKLHAPHGHLAPVFGAVTSALEIHADAAANLFLFTHLRGLIAAAVRLGIVGPMEAQSLQHEFTETSRKIVIHSLTLALDDIAQTAPLQEIWQGAQDRLYSRLFQS